MLVTSCKIIQTTIGDLLHDFAVIQSCQTAETFQPGCLTGGYCHRVLQKSNGGGVAISSLEKKKPVVLFFYPKVVLRWVLPSMADGPLAHFPCTCSAPLKMPEFTILTGTFLQTH